MTSDLIVLIVSNAVSLVVGVLCGKSVRWHRVERNGHAYPVPSLRGPEPARARLLGVAVALVAVVITVQTTYLNIEQSKANDRQTACNAEFTRVLANNADIGKQERAISARQRAILAELVTSLAQDVAVQPSMSRNELRDLFDQFNREAQDNESALLALDTARDPYPDEGC